MKAYFLVEGSQTETVLYPEWLNILRPEMVRITNPQKAKDYQACYALYSGDGYPNIIQQKLTDSIYDLIENPYFDYFVIVMDSEEESITQRHQIINERLKEIQQDKRLILPTHTSTQIIIQHRCIETWLLGNRVMLDRNTDEKILMDCITHYNVAELDPELMLKPTSVKGSTAQYHTKYLKAMLRAKRCSFSKSNPVEVCKEAYLKQLQNRVIQTQHLASLKVFLDFITPSL